MSRQRQIYHEAHFAERLSLRIGDATAHQSNQQTT
jgi:hypothetical protein